MTHLIGRYLRLPGSPLVVILARSIKGKFRVFSVDVMSAVELITILCVVLYMLLRLRSSHLTDEKIAIFLDDWYL